LVHSALLDKQDQEENQVYLDCLVQMGLLETLEFPVKLAKREIKDLKGTRDQLGFRDPEA